jgi:hypothetical protein
VMVQDGGEKYKEPVAKEDSKSGQVLTSLFRSSIDRRELEHVNEHAYFLIIKSVTYAASRDDIYFWGIKIGRWRHKLP